MASAQKPASAAASPRRGEASHGLDQLPVGSVAAIVRMDDADHVMMIRLKTMGMHVGRAVRLLRGGSRIVVQCAGTRIGLSAEVARHVLVQPL